MLHRPVPGSVSDDLLRSYLDSYTETPWEALKYLIAEANYGGRVTDELDRRLLGSYLSRCVHVHVSVSCAAAQAVRATTPVLHPAPAAAFKVCRAHTNAPNLNAPWVLPLYCYLKNPPRFYCEDALAVVNFKLSPLPQYFIPEPGSTSSYRDYILTLPTTDRPEAFGQHPNAEISYLIEDSKALLGGMLALAPRTGSGSSGAVGGSSGGGAAAGGSARQEELVEALANDLLEQVSCAFIAPACTEPQMLLLWQKGVWGDWHWDRCTTAHRCCRRSPPHSTLRLS